MKNRVISAIISLLILVLVIVAAKAFTVQTITVEFGYQSSYDNAEEIIEVSGIEDSTFIWAIDETAMINNIAEYFDDNSIYIYNIERVFPNKVIIYIEERTGIFVVESDLDANKVAITDCDFQLNTLIDIEEISMEDYITISGIAVENTYNTTAFKQIKEVADGIIENSNSTVNLIEIVEEINYSEEMITIFYIDGTIEEVLLT